MRATYQQKLDLVRCGLEVIATAQHKLREELDRFLHPGDTVWVRINGKVHRAGFLGWTSDGRLDLELQPGGWNTFANVADLVEEPAS